MQSWDTANKATELSDYSVCTTWGVKGKHLFLIGLFRRRLEYPALKRAVREQQNLFNASVVLIEDKATGTQLFLVDDGAPMIVASTIASPTHLPERPHDRSEGGATYGIKSSLTGCEMISKAK